jgi:hypothetical protein
MLFKKKSFVSVLFFISLTLGIGSWPGVVQAMDCTKEAFAALGLTDEKFGKLVTIDSAVVVPPANNVPEYCDVVGTMWPTIRFEVALPTTAWNGRLLMAGNGGKAGTIPKSGNLLNSGSIVGALQLGYAATGTDTGHCSAYITSNPGGCPVGTQLYAGLNGSAFAYENYPTPGANPDWYQKLEDFAHRAVHETIIVAKEMVNAYYAKPSAYTYWVGCSTGGRQGLMEAQRYPSDFNGILDGCAVNSYMAQQMAGPEQLGPQYSTGCDITGFCGGPQIPPANLSALGAAIYAKCDSIDGLVDGIIDDPRRCRIDPEKDLVRCPQEGYTPYTAQPTTCFTTAQLGALKKIYAGGFTSSGKLVVAGTQTGAEAFSPGGWGTWMVNNSLKAAQRYSVVGDAFNYLTFVTPLPNFNFLTDWSWDVHPPLTAVRGELLDATDPNLGGFYSRGGKLLMYHGWADVSANPLVNTLPYYKKVMEVMPRAKDFLAYYMVPGMGHCGSGVGYSTIDWLTPLVDWVENGREPGSLIGKSILSPTSTRPICRYPEVSRYNGTGSIDDAASFTCVNIIPAKVRIEPETINLKSNGVFTAFFNLPGHHHKNHWHDRGHPDLTVVCEGAPAVKGTLTRHGDGYVAKFRTQDLINITPGDKITFTAYAILDAHGETIAFEGSDTVRVRQK